ncbi:hypothetical protein N2152v2_009270 [Parachlorella kessleri]
MEPKYFLAAQLWYGLSQGVAAFILPFINVYFDQLGFTGAQIGLLSSLRPLIAAPCGSLIAALADRWQAHRFMLVGTFVASVVFQSSMALTGAFPLILVLTVLASVVLTPSSIIADASVMAASDHPGDYGRARTWASLTWTILSPIAGLVDARFGIPVGIACYAVGSFIAIPTALALPVHALRRKIAPVMLREPSLGKEGERPEEQQPLLVEEGPASPDTPQHGAALSRAIAIIRYIEAITEMGVAPPAGAQFYGFAELSTPYAARHLDPENLLPPPSPFHLDGDQPGVTGAFLLGVGLEPDLSYDPLPLTNSPKQPPSPPGTATQGGGTGGYPGSLHATSLPRPISSDSLGRVASLATMPRIRTRLKLSETDQPNVPEDSPSPPSESTSKVASPEDEGVFTEGLEYGEASRRASRGSPDGAVGASHGPGGPTSPFALGGSGIAAFGLDDLEGEGECAAAGAAAAAPGQAGEERGRGEAAAIQPQVPPPPRLEGPSGGQAATPPAAAGAAAAATAAAVAGDGRLLDGHVQGLNAAMATGSQPEQQGQQQPSDGHAAEAATAAAAADGVDAGAGDSSRFRQQLSLDGAPSASLLLQDVRNIVPSRPAVVVAASGSPRRLHPNQGLPPRSPAQQAAAGATAAGGSPAGSGSLGARQSSGSSGSTARSAGAAGTSSHALLLSPGEGEHATIEAATPGARYRSAAVQRLIDLFGGSRGGGSTAGGTVADEASAGTAQRAGQPAKAHLQSAFSSSVEESADSGTLGGRAGREASLDGPWALPAAESVAGWSLGGVNTPVRRYIEYRKDKLEKQRSAGALTTPFSPERVAKLGLGAIGEHQELAGMDDLMTPELLREAVVVEASSVTDPTDSLVIRTLGKKLDRMIRAQEAAERRRLRKLQRAGAAAAAAAEAGAAGLAGGEVGDVAGRAVPAAAADGGAAVFDGRQPYKEPAANPAKAPLEPLPSAESPTAAASHGFLANLGRLLGDAEVVTFFALCLLMGLGHGVVGNYLFMYLARLGASEALMGYVLAANALPELPVFYFFGSILQLLGMHTLLLLSAGALALRLSAYLEGAPAKDVGAWEGIPPRLLRPWGTWWVLPIETLHAITFAAGWSACAINSSKISPPGLESTTQGLFQGLWTGLGSGIGGLVGGLLYHHVGPEQLFKLSGLFMLGGTALCAAVFVGLRWRRKGWEARDAAGYEQLPGAPEAVP